ncbi:hypothetical protein Hte_007914 [Hypoxylon texense]
MDHEEHHKTPKQELPDGDLRREITELKRALENKEIEQIQYQESQEMMFIFQDMATNLERRLSRKIAQNVELQETNARLREEVISLTPGAEKMLKETNAALQKQNATLQAEIEQKKAIIPEKAKDKREHLLYWDGFLEMQRVDSQKSAHNSYVSVIKAVQHWVRNYCEPIGDSEELQAQSIEYARRNRKDINDFASRLGDIADISRATEFGPVDTQLITAFIIRYLQDSIFDTVLGNSVPGVVNVVNNIEDSLRNWIMMDDLDIAVWRSVTMRGLIMHPHVQERREQAVEAISNELARLLSFARGDMTENEFAKSISSVVRSAMMAHQSFCPSLYDYRLETNTSIFRAGEMFCGEKDDLFDDVVLLDATRGGKAFHVQEFKPLPSTEDIRKKLHIVCSLSPALWATVISTDPEERIPFSISPGRVLAVWEPEKARKDQQSNQQSSSWLWKVVSTVKDTQH